MAKRAGAWHAAAAMVACVLLASAVSAMDDWAGPTLHVDDSNPLLSEMATLIQERQILELRKAQILARRVDNIQAPAARVPVIKALAKVEREEDEDMEHAAAIDNEHIENPFVEPTLDVEDAVAPRLRPNAGPVARLVKGKGAVLPTFIRLRPLHDREEPAPGFEFKCDNEAGQMTIEHTKVEVDLGETKETLLYPDETHAYSGLFCPSDFASGDRADLGPDNAEVYDTAVLPVVSEMLSRGLKSDAPVEGTVFCYGYTGSGKTHTMEGTAEDPGVLVQAAAEMFRYVESQPASNRLVVKVMDFEIYGNDPGKKVLLLDLIHRGPKENPNPSDLAERWTLDIMGPTDFKTADIFGFNRSLPKKGGVKMPGRHDPWEAVSDLDGLMRLFKAGATYRQVTRTKGNPAGSSRSHRVFRIGIFKDTEVANQIRVGKGRKAPPARSNVKATKPIRMMTLVDLAGLELMSDTDARGVKATNQEGTVIRKSLMAVKNMIVAIARNPKKTPTRYIHEAFLARILYPAFVSGMPAVMIANAAPPFDDSNFKRTVNTCRYAGVLVGGPDIDG